MNIKKRFTNFTWKLIAAAMILALNMPAPAQADVVLGRIAISSDGNEHDLDDIFATAVSVALLSKTGNASKLVYYGHSDHVWKTSVTREEAMRKSSYETAKLYGGFDLSVFYNATTQTGVAVAKLVAEINKSTATDPLTIIGAGPMDIIGRAINASDPTKRKFVKYISHSTWNDAHAATHGSNWSFNSICALTNHPICIHIADQNGGLSKNWADYNVWRDSPSPRLKWLYSRAKAGRSDWPDCSDAGMVYFITMNVSTSHKVTTPEIKALLAESTTTTTLSTPTTTTTTTTLPTVGDSDNDGLNDTSDPCPLEANNVCFGPVATDTGLNKPIRVNSGGGGAECAGQKIDCAGRTWAADFGFTGGTTTVCNLGGGAEACVINNIAPVIGCDNETTEDLFQCERYGKSTSPMSYAFNVPAGDYLVNLYFANTYTGTTAVGSRVFDVLIEGSVVLSKFDQVSAAQGSGKLVVRSIPITVTDGKLNITFKAITENPAIKAIEVLSFLGEGSTTTTTLPNDTTTTTLPTVTTTTTTTTTLPPGPDVIKLFTEAPETTPILNPEKGPMNWAGGNNQITYTPSVVASALDKMSSPTRAGLAGPLTLSYYRTTLAPTGPTAGELANMRTNLNAHRPRGMKTVLLFRYDTTDPTLANMLGDITKLGNAMDGTGYSDGFGNLCDVIAVLDVGMFGNFGEWHGSGSICEAGSAYEPTTAGCNYTCNSNNKCVGENLAGTEISCTDNADCVGGESLAVIEKAMAEFCPTGDLQRQVNGRRASLKDIKRYSTPPSSTTAYDGSNNSRLGFYNHGLLSAKYQGNTFTCYSGQSYFQYMYDRTKFTLMEGESSDSGGIPTDGTCSVDACSGGLNGGGRDGRDCDPHVSPTYCQTNSFGTCIDYKACPAAETAATQFHLTMLRDGYSNDGATVNRQDDVNTFKHWSDGGCLGRMKTKLGAAFVLTSATFPSQVTPGSPFTFKMSMKNKGFANTPNKRTAYLVARRADGTRYDFILKTNMRRWDAGQTTNIVENLVPPVSMPTGTYELSLWMPDIAPTLRWTGDGGLLPSHAAAVKYSIRLYNDSVWDSSTGFNKIGQFIVN